MNVLPFHNFEESLIVRMRRGWRNTCQAIKEKIIHWCTPAVYTCPTCNGGGQAGHRYTCWTCLGEGHISRQQRAYIRKHNPRYPYTDFTKVKLT